MRGSHGTFYWNELMTRDVEGAKKFYADTLGWNYDGMPMPGGGGTYWLAMMDGEPVGGILDISAPEFGPVPESWMSYIAVDDVDARVAKAVKAGAKLMKPVVRRARRRPHRHPDAARRRRHWLDDAGRAVASRNRPWNRIASSPRTNGSPRARRISPRKRRFRARAMR